jgi:hypothetical protein
VPYVPRLFLKTGIIYLATTFLLGAVLLVFEAAGRPAPFIISIEHGHMGFVGWVVNTVIGVALWLLPVNRNAFPQTQGRYSEAATRGAFYLLNVGLLLRLFAEPVHAWHPATATAAALVAAGLSQLAGVAIVAWTAWQRVFAPPMRPI